MKIAVIKCDKKIKNIMLLYSNFFPHTTLRKSLKTSLFSVCCKALLNAV